MKTLKCLIVLFLLTSVLILFTIFITEKSKANNSNFILLLEQTPNANILVNFTNFQYKINNYMCKDFKDDELLGIIIVTSYVGHDVLRSSHRTAFSQEKLKKNGLLRIFLIAEIPPTEKFITQEAIFDEQNRFGDLIQGNFQEAYKNLTYKHIMGLKWAADKCRNAKYIIKIDDDTVYDIYHLQNYLIDLEIDSKKIFLAGFVLSNKKPIRLQVSKWYVKHNEFKSDKYPEYLSGWLYITNPQTATNLVLESEITKFFWIDDTYVTGILRDRLKIKLMNLNKWFSANSEFLDCCIKDLKSYSYKCDYYVGPNGGDDKMIIDYTNAIKKCYFMDNNCIDRNPNKTLMKTCVGRYKNIIKDHGEAIIENFKL